MHRRALTFLAAIPLFAACGTLGESATTCRIGGLTGPASLSEGGRLRVQLDLPAGASVEVGGSSSLGTAVDAAGMLTVKAPYGLAGDESLELHATCGADHASLTLPVTVHKLAWSQIHPWSGEEGPAAREYCALWTDPVDPDALYVYGGFGFVPHQFTPMNDLWKLDLATEKWTRLETTGTPGLPGGRLAPSPDGRSAYYFGGLDMSSQETPFAFLSLDVHATPATWSAVPGKNEPWTGSYTGGLVYDAPNQRYVGFCGVNSQRGMDCTLNAFDTKTGTWSVLPTAPGAKPRPREGFHFVFDAENDRIVMFSGDMSVESQDFAQDTWALELGETPVRWVQLAGPQDPPIGRRNGAWVLDPENHRMLVWGGTADGMNAFPGLFAFDLDRGHEGWTRVETANPPPDRASGMATYDGKRHRVLMGFGNNNSARYADLWALSL